jgi:hypothetical protein
MSKHEEKFYENTFGFTSEEVVYLLHIAHNQLVDLYPDTRRDKNTNADDEYAIAEKVHAKLKLYLELRSGEQE